MADTPTLPAAEIKKRKKIGTLEGDAVYQISTIGGLHLVVAARKRGAETLGAGTHPAVALHLAKKRGGQNLMLSDLNKSEHVPYECFEHLVPRGERLTAAFRQAEEQRR